ncbi:MULTISPECIES: hypothetical protein [unclassified Acinetobacter]|uniref:hypothetical protein n=1 Tax=unclassified Acinetobacter TaxID=196816 RepID=UPI0015D43BC7|nr:MULTISPECIES: hypothetical protein [unclassified Acinetobacter]
MTLILKSDQIASNSIGNIYGINGELDFQVMLDFNRGLYRYNEAGALKDISLAEAITLTRASKAEYKDKTGATKVAQANEPRIHYMSDLGVQGLLIETARTNLFLNPNSPVTQTIQIPNTGIAQALALKVEGTGSATMSGDVTSLSRAAATEGNPQGALPISGPETISVTVTITGNVTRCQLERTPSSTGGNYASSFIPADIASRAGDAVLLSDLLANKLATAKTIVCQFAYQERLVKGFVGSMGVVSLEDKNNVKGGVFLTRALAATSGDATQKTVVVNPGSSSIAKQNAMPSVDSRKVTSVVAFSQGGLDVIQAVNGSAKEVPGESLPIDFNKMTIGGGDGFSTATGAAGGILTRLAIYDRKLTAEEISKISTSWL